MEKVTESIDDIGLAQFILDKGHDMWKIRLAGVLTIDDLWRRHAMSII